MINLCYGIDVAILWLKEKIMCCLTVLYAFMWPWIMVPKCHYNTMYDLSHYHTQLLHVHTHTLIITQFLHMKYISSMILHVLLVIKWKWILPSLNRHLMSLAGWAHCLLGTVSSTTISLLTGASERWRSVRPWSYHLFVQKQLEIFLIPLL